MITIRASDGGVEAHLTASVQEAGYFGSVDLVGHGADEREAVRNVFLGLQELRDRCQVVRSKKGDYES